MKILVMSDSHGFEQNMRTAIERERDADVLVFLGDGEYDFKNCIDDMPGLNSKQTIAVCGNCDGMSFLPVTSFDTLGGHKFYITHGFRQQVKFGLDYIYMDALKHEREVVLFGHTHRAVYEEWNGIHLFNPGALMNGSYGVINLYEDGEMSFEHYEI